MKRAMRVAAVLLLVLSVGGSRAEAVGFDLVVLDEIELRVFGSSTFSSISSIALLVATTDTITAGDVAGLTVTSGLGTSFELSNTNVGLSLPPGSWSGTTTLLTDGELTGLLSGLELGNVVGGVSSIVTFSPGLAAGDSVTTEHTVRMGDYAATFETTGRAKSSGSNQFTAQRVSALRVVPVPGAVWMGLVVLGGLGIGSWVRGRG